jgi:hypothetical protein
MTNKNRGIAGLKGADLRKRQNTTTETLENPQPTETLPAQGEDFHIAFPDEPNLEDDESLGKWLKNAHQASERLDMAIGKVLQQKRELLNSQGKDSGGGWQQWVEENCDFSVRTANRYIKVYEDDGKNLPPQGGDKAGKPVRASVTFTDEELGSFCKEAKKAKRFKQRLNEKMEQAARDVREELLEEAKANGVSLDDHLHNERNKKNEKDVTPNSNQN